MGINSTDVYLSAADFSRFCQLQDRAKAAGYRLRRDGAPDRPFVIWHFAHTVCTMVDLDAVADWLADGD